ncbi:hypothetical protein AU381_05595 [Sinorhizobium glycinis]|uniref:Uncharacterized protein n=1 Tax=Sinorhizobium glycinis TaxID=1472378 RepID=A0A178Y3N2_9HYPH|nr:hypothetical protein [Sinorhizobium glycinis]OAP41345.1 hypothetical protein AU381_05595 [Sinorhizobium glycinis]
MAKQPTSKSGTSRIRFIMLDAEIPEGDLSQITSAIQNALKPNTTIIQQRLPNQLPAAGLPNGAAEVDADSDGDLIDAEIEAPFEPDSVRAQRASRSRKPTVPKVLDLDLTSGVSLETFANEHSPKNDIERNLVVLDGSKSIVRRKPSRRIMSIPAIGLLGGRPGLTTFRGPFGL